MRWHEGDSQGTWARRRRACEGDGATASARLPRQARDGTGQARVMAMVGKGDGRQGGQQARVWAQASSRQRGVGDGNGGVRMCEGEGEGRVRAGKGDGGRG